MSPGAGGGRRARHSPRGCSDPGVSPRKVTRSPALARVGAAQPPPSALLPMAEHADLCRRFPALLEALGAGGRRQQSPFPLPSPHPAPPGARRELGHNQDTGTAAQGQAVGGWQCPQRVPCDSGE